MSDRTIEENVDSLSHLLATLKVTANVFHNGQYCGNWAVDTSGSHYISFHAVSYGRCFVQAEGDEQIHTLSQGDVVLFPRDSKHTITSDPSLNLPVNTTQSSDFHELASDGTGLVCGYFEHQHPMINSIIEHLPTMVIINKQSDHTSPLAMLTDALLSVSKQQGEATQLILTRLSECILALLFRDHLKVDRGILAALADPKLAPAIQAIFAQPETKWTVEQLAEKCYSSRTSFTNLFKQTMAVSPIEFATQWRLGLGYRALADEGASTLSAALSCGYESEASFSKAFKRVFGVSPGQVRQASSV